MLDGIRRRKITLLFLVLDADENGYLERTDFERVAVKLGELGKFDMKSESFLVLKATFTHVFDSIEDLIDRNFDDKVELGEWVQYFEKVLDDEDKYADLIEPMARNIFVLLDHNSNGKISLEEFENFAKVYRIEDRNIKGLFDKLDTNDNGFITRDEFGYMITDFFLSEDPDVPGNFIFGDF